MSSKTAPPVEIAPELLARPRLAADVSVHEPAEEGAPWVIQRGQHTYFRVQPDLARLALAVNGTRDHAGLADILGPPWTVEAVGTAVGKLAEGRLLDNGERVRQRSRWVKFVPPLTVQFTVLRPERLLRRFSPLVRLLTSRAGVAAAVALALCGLLALAAQAPRVRMALGQPLPLSTYLAVVGGVLATTAVHEFGHGAVLSHHGGRPGRMGVMLFYMSPAFFCDVSDGWRLPRRQQRVAVALAGIATQVVIAGAAAVASLFAEAHVRDGLIVFAVVTYISGLLNLTPFVKLDGYIALMSHLDIPHLRDRALDDARRFTARILFGGRHERRLPQRWAIPFGLACMAFPLYMVATAMRLWADSLQRLGAFGASLVLCGIGYLACHLVRGLVRLVREARAGGARALRIAAVVTLAVAVAGAALTFVKVPYSVSGGYLVRDGGRVELVLAPSADRSVIRENTAVRLYRAGVAARTETGQAVVAGGDGTDTTAPLSVFLPLRTDALPAPAVSYPLTASKAPDDRVGVAQVDAGTRSVGAWLYARYVAPAWRW
ncbi:daptide biosynthesis intramembrane metalloprotease [Streptomyces sp. LaBMicrA B280]|uniref:daptide biosynthesis intramembrane metalloprotease n=1 Tax=Streptomyces sp. LaBMicrA B280 TaxID=3391001 RepID=UPI003BA4ECE9